MLHEDAGKLRSRAESFAQRAGANAKLVELQSVVGGGSAPETYVPSWGVALDFRGCSDAELERRLRSGDPPVIVRLEEGRVVLDFRTIFAVDEEELLRNIRQILG
jgi:L-seryl-tRNA(Ser) seleniumtransferase